MSFKVNAIVDIRTAQKDVTIDNDQLTEGFVGQPSIFAHYGVKHAEAERQYAEAKQNLDVVISQVDKAIREKAVAESLKITEKQIEAQVNRNRAVSSAQTSVIEAREQETIARHYIDAFKQRKDSLWSLGLQKRAEMESGIVIKNSEAKSAALKATREKMSENVKKGAAQD